MKYTTVLFDLDGTLVDSGIGVTNSVAYALDKFGITPPPRQELFKFIGPPLTQSFREFCGFDGEKTTLAIKYYREYYSQKGIFECTMYEGVLELMKSLKRKGYKLGLATSKPEIYATQVIENKGISKYIDYVGAATADEKTRATKESVIEAFPTLGISRISRPTTPSKFTTPPSGQPSLAAQSQPAAPSACTSANSKSVNNSKRPTRFIAPSVASA